MESLTKEERNFASAWDSKEKRATSRQFYGGDGELAEVCVNSPRFTVAAAPGMLANIVKYNPTLDGSLPSAY